jgi:CRISPR-associated protein Csm1
MGFHYKEYQTVILAALLHDIGKFMNRDKDVRRKHPYFSADYVAHDNFKKILKDEWIYFGLLKDLVQRHHEYPKMPDDLLVQTIKDQHTRALAYIVSRADSYSSGERIEEEPAELNFKNARLASVLSRIKKEKDNQDFRYYKLNRLSPEASFPVKEDELFQLTYDYDKLKLLDKIGSYLLELYSKVHIKKVE